MVSDLHLGDKAPVARSAEASWHDAQVAMLKQLCKYQQRYKCPVIIAGDLFDRPTPPPWVINMALKHLPERCYAVPGQHDMIHMNYSDLNKTAFWTVREAGRLVLLEPGRPVEIAGAVPIRLHGFPWGVQLRPLENPHDLAIEVAVVHDYIWLGSESGYKDAPEHKRLAKRFASMKGYDVAVFGDNHQHFMADHKPLVYNCGAFQRRKSDEKNYPPMVGLLLANGKVKRKRLDVSQERWLDNAADAEAVLGGSSAEFVKELEQLGDAALDYAEAVRRRLLSGGITTEVREVVLRCLEGVKQ